MEWNQHLVIDGRAAWREVDGEIFIVTGQGMLHNIANDTGLFIWQELQRGSATGDSLLAALLAEFDVSESEARSDLMEFLTALESRGIIKAG